METQAIPFQLRDFMVKCWKRHRDVPTKISELIDRAVDDLQRRQLDLKQRMSENILKVEPFDKVTDLLDCWFLVGESLPANGDADSRILNKAKTEGYPANASKRRYPLAKNSITIYRIAEERESGCDSKRYYPTSKQCGSKVGKSSCGQRSKPRPRNS
jgi:hypothetical protein